MDYEERLGLLIAAAEEQQQTAQKAVDSLVATAQLLKTAPEGLKKALEASTSENLGKVSAGVEKTLQGATKDARDQIQAAAKDMAAARTWMSWQWVTLAGLLAVGMVGVVWLGVWALTDSYREELAEARATVAQLENRGGKAKLSTCDGRLCVAVVPGKVYGDQKDPYMVIRK